MQFCYLAAVEKNREWPGDEATVLSPWYLPVLSSQGGLESFLPSKEGS